MSHREKLREHKACENCGHFVEKRYCPECGQENVETRQPFHYLFTVSIEDFVHYDSRFWKSILYLLFYPARLTKIYLSGKRKLYVPPVTLYIFVSFITFFIPTLLPEKGGEKKETPSETITTQTDSLQEVGKNIREITDRLAKNYNKEDLKKLKEMAVAIEMKEKSRQVNNDKPGSFVMNGNRSLLSKAEIEILKERIIHDFPKAVFLYMPVFAFWLWLLHSKKKWYYFDHGIFTLHYFSFILLSVLMFILFHWAYSFFGLGRFGWINTIAVFASIAFFSYFIYYFFHSHRMIYRNSKAVSRLICAVLLFINTICMLIFLVSYLAVETYFTKHTIFTEAVNELHKLNS